MQQSSFKTPLYLPCFTGCYKVWQVIPNYFNFAEFMLTEKDAKEYKYSKSTKQRVHKWKDIKVKLYI